MSISTGDPTTGLVTTDSEGRVFMTSQGAWVEFEPDGGSYRTGGIVAGWFADGADGFQFRVNPDAPVYAQEWADATLGSMAGVAGQPGNWVVVDPVTMIQQNVPDGVFYPNGEEVELLYVAAGEYVYLDVADDHAWLIDDTTALMVLQGEEGLVVGGWAEVEGGDVVFHYATEESPELEERVTQVLTSSLVDEVAPHNVSPGVEATLSDGSALSGADMSQIKFFFSCGWCQKAANKANDSIIQPSKRKLGELADSAGDAVDAGKDKAVDLGDATIDGLETGYIYLEKGVVATAKTTKKIVVKTVNGVIRLIDFFSEHGCGSSDNAVAWWNEVLFTGSPGPGKGSDGSGAPDFPRSGYLVGQQETELLQLARVWMPAIQLSRDEKCGEIVRIMAKVFPYAKDGKLITEPPYLSRAALVEVVYTLMLRYDGGRFCNLPGVFLGNPVFTPDAAGLEIGLPFLDFPLTCGFHPGDNEGFSVALKRATHSGGNCALTGFELVGGRTAAHTGGSVKTDLHPGQVPGFPCPSGPAGRRGPSGEGYVLWVSESKHGTYWDRDECEGELAGSEECEGGRGSYNLASRVELWDEDWTECPYEELSLDEKGSWPPEYWANGGPDTYLEHEREMKAFVCLARGRPGPQKDNYRLDVGVPDVSGMTVEEAREALSEHGLSLSPQIGSVEMPSGSPDIGRVVVQSPTAGRSVPFGTTVSLDIGGSADSLPPEQPPPSQPPPSQPPSSNNAPVAVNDALTVNPSQVGTLVSFTLTDNDSDPDGDSLSLTSVTCVQGCDALASSQFYSGGWIEIVADPSYPESYVKIVLQYEVSDGVSTANATVTIEVFYV